MSDETDADDTVVIPALREQVLAGLDCDAGDTEGDRSYSLTEPERLWLDWFYSLSADDQAVVERCGEYDLSVDADNFEQMKQVLLSNETKRRS